MLRSGAVGGGMSKVFMGVRLQRLREERGLSQVALARLLGLSASYLNQLERNQRPLTVPVLLKISAVLNVDAQLFSEDDAAALTTDLRAVLGEVASSGDGAGAVSQAEIKALVDNMPQVGRAIVRLHRQWRAAGERADLLAAQAGAGERDMAYSRPTADEAVRDYLNQRQNHVAELDERAEAIAMADAPAHAPQRIAATLMQRLASRHGVRTLATSGAGGPDGLMDKRRFDPVQRVLWLAPSMSAGQQAFAMAAELALLEAGDVIDGLAAAAGLDADVQTRRLARVALSNYFAGALLMPYRRFLEAAEAHRYDVEHLAFRFGVGFEAVCHRLSTLQRPGTCGLPFFFVRVDRAGNVSKRQSATAFHFSRVGGTCPLWIVYEAFSRPQQIVTQLARMPDGRTYFWVARQVSSGPPGYQSLQKTFAVALGCDVSQAHRLVYAQGLALSSSKGAQATPIGPGCKVCERGDCPQRAVASIVAGTPAPGGLLPAA
jgi:predicted transcriptional regulator/transcriptional regulator with XRE-family HTH domain